MQSETPPTTDGILNSQGRVSTVPETHETFNGGTHAAVVKTTLRKSRSRSVAFITLMIAAVIASTAYYFFNVWPYESTDDAFIEGHVISISPQVSALVAAVHVDDNQCVRRGDLLVELDPTDYQLALQEADASLESEKGKLGQAQASVDNAASTVSEAQAAVDSAQATFDNALSDLQRYEGLSPESRIQLDFDRVKATRKTAAAAVDQAKAHLRSVKAQVESAEASKATVEADLLKAQADVRQAQINLSRCRIVAPDDGRITNKTVEAGAYVTPANPLFQIVPPEVWVVANFKETQLTHIRTGQSVRVTVDSYPNLPVKGTVDSIQDGTGSRFSIIPAENATGNFVKVVQRLPVKIRLAPEAGTDAGVLLAPGMSVEPVVRVR